MKKPTKNLPVVIEPETKEELEKVLTDKQQLFCLEYIKDSNATDAYKRVGYKCSDNTARANGSRMLTNANIQKYIEILKKEIVESTKIDIEYIIKNTVEIIERSMQHRQVFDREGNAVLTQTPNGQLAAAYIFDAKSALGGLSLLTEHLPDWKKQEDENKIGGIEITLNNYLGQPNNTYFPVTPETEHLAKLLGIETDTAKKKKFGERS